VVDADRLLLDHPGTAGTYEDNSALFEYLASHGYIVVSSAYPEPDGHSVLIGGDIAGSFADLAFLVNRARALPNADADRLGVMGHSYGAWVSFAWSANVDLPIRDGNGRMDPRAHLTRDMTHRAPHLRQGSAVTASATQRPCSMPSETAERKWMPA
jgi:hypothetical protein